MTMTSYDQQDTCLAKRVLSRIEGGHLVPRPRWEFIARNCLFWVLSALAVALGARAFSMSLFEVENVDWRLSAASFFWIGVLALSIGIGYVTVRRTDHGYRYPIAVVALGAMLASLALGACLYAVGL